MTDKKEPKRLSETVIPGKDYAAKVKIDTVLDTEVLILEIEKMKGSAEFALVDPETGEIVMRDYWNVVISLREDIFTFSTGAVPIDKVLTALAAKLDTQEVNLPLLATFRKQGRTYVVE